MPSEPAVAATFQPALDHLETVLRGLRTGRASTGLLEPLMVEAYGGTMRLQEIASITTPDARTIQVEPWDRALVKTVEKALSQAPLGTAPTVAGSVIRVVLPPLTEERRVELSKVVRQHVEECRIAIRGVREKLLKDLRVREESGALSEDMAERDRKRTQQEVDAAVAAADARGRAKEDELLRF